jgi:hypothetical protein
MGACKVCGDLDFGNHPGASNIFSHCHGKDVAIAVKEGCIWCSMIWRGIAAFLRPSDVKAFSTDTMRAFNIILPDQKRRKPFSISAYYGWWHWNRLNIEYYVPEGIYEICCAEHSSRSKHEILKIADLFRATITFEVHPPPSPYSRRFFLRSILSDYIRMAFGMLSRTSSLRLLLGELRVSASN